MATDYTQDANCEIAWLMNIDEDPITDSSGNGNTGALRQAGSPNFTNSGKYDGGYEWSGSDDITAPIGPGDIATNTCSSVIWVKSSNDDERKVYFTADDGGGNRYYIRQDSTDASGGNILVGLSSWQETQNGVFDIGTWTHYALVLDGTTGYCYVDGVAIDSQTGIAVSLPTTALELGDSKSPGDSMTGILDEYGLFSRALSSTEVNDIMNDGLDGSQAPTPTGVRRRQYMTTNKGYW